MLDAVVVGSGPNGLAAAMTLAEGGYSVRVHEASSTPGGGVRSAALTLPGFVHDVCSTVQALAMVSPYFRALALDVPYLYPSVSYAHPLDDGRAGLAYRSLSDTVSALGVDGSAWSSVFGPLVGRSAALYEDLLGDLRSVPAHPILMARFGLPGLLPAAAWARSQFVTDEAQALFAGAAAHSMRSLSAPLTTAFGLALAVSAHGTGWPVVAGGSGVLTDAVVARLVSLGVEIDCDHRVSSLDSLPASRVVLLDVGPSQLLAFGAGSASYRKSLQRFRYGPGIFKVDYALSGPVPWTNPEVRRAGTVHLGGTLADVARSEAAVEAGVHSDWPFVLVVQPGVVDDSRAPGSAQTLWAYCHVPSGSTLDRTDAIERQLERFAPGFRDLVLARSSATAASFEAYDANYVGGDINGGRAGLFQSVLGPVPRWSRYRVSDGVYACSASTPPGGGVHGMSGVNAAREAIRRSLARRSL